MDYNLRFLEPYTTGAKKCNLSGNLEYLKKHDHFKRRKKGTRNNSAIIKLDTVFLKRFMHQIEDLW